jgi:glutamine amidotransferase
MAKAKIIIIDYDLGNLFSVELACQAVGLEAEISADKKSITEADALILPGVGSFGDAMQNLKRFDLVDPIQNFVESGKPMMGVCLGMQLLFTRSEEFGNTEGLNIIPGAIKRLPSNPKQPVKVPQIGWNKVAAASIPFEKTPLRSTVPGAFMYFVHSFYATPDDKGVVLTTTNYGDTEYCSSVFRDNIFATQFHPEKSTRAGVKIYEEWATMNNLI